LDEWRKRKRNRRHCGYEYIVSIFHVIFSFFVLAFSELSLLRTHFRSFTEVVRKRRREVTWELGEEEPIAWILNESDDTAEWLLLNTTNTPPARLLLSTY